MTDFCPVVDLDLASPYATLVDAKVPGSDTRRAIDATSWLACNNEGATIDSAAWAIHPDDDDGSLTLSQESGTTVSSVLISGGTVGSSYRLVCTLGLSDGQSIPVTIQIPVRDVAKQPVMAA